MTCRFNKMIRDARLRLNLTSKELIYMLGRNYSASYLTKIESHGEIPAPEVVIRLAFALGLDEKMLLETAKKEKLEAYKQLLDRRYKSEC